MNHTRLDLGAHYTPDDIADYLAALLAQGLRYAPSTPHVLDPACGDGALLRAVHQAIPAAQCHASDVDQRALDELRGVDGWLVSRTRRDFLTGDWPYETPVYAGVIMNPPYLGGTKISGRFGSEYLTTLKREWGHKGRADIAASFVRAACERAKHAVVGIYTNTIAQGDTRRVGLQWALANGWEIYAADTNIPWPGKAAVTCSIVAMRRVM